MSTTVLVNSLVQTLDLDRFISEIEQLDRVSCRQCVLRALKELSQSRTIRLHGQRLVRKALRDLQEYREQMEASGAAGKGVLKRAE